MIPCFIKTSNNIIFFTFGIIDDKYVCIPKKIDDYKGSNYHQWYQDYYVKLLSKYYHYTDAFACKLYLVSKNDVIDIYDPSEYVQSKKYLQEDKSSYVKKIIDSICDYFEISPSDIGVEGSHVLNCSTRTSDIDLFVYGFDNSKIIQNNFISFSNYPAISLFSQQQMVKYCQDRINCGFGYDLESVINQFKKRYYGFINNQQFSIVCVPKMNDKGFINLNRNIVYTGFIQKKMLVIDDTYSSIIPAIYKCVDDDGNIYMIEMYNHYGINQAKNGDYLYIQANEYYDVNLSERLVIYGFWNKNEKFHVLGGNDEKQRAFRKIIT